VAALALAASAVPAGPVAALVALGVVVALGGHLAGSRRTVVAGLAILFAASALMIVGGYLAYRDDPGAPRPCALPGAC
jgi:ABC-type Na+ efflux pump permease subunit